MRYDDLQLSEANLTLVRHGSHLAEVTFVGDLTKKAGDRANLVVGPLTLSMTVVNATSVGPGTHRLRLVSGSGTMSTPTNRAQNLTDTGGEAILNVLLGYTKEVRGRVPATVLNASYKQEQVSQGVPVGVQLSRFLARFQGAVWRHQDTGEVAVYDTDGQVVGSLPEAYAEVDSLLDGSKVLELQDFDAGTKFPREGQLFPVGNYLIDQIDVQVTGTKATATFYKTSLHKVLDSIVARDHRTPFSQGYPCTIVAQNSDGQNSSTLGGTLQLLPDDARMRGLGLDKVAIRSLPNLALKVPVDSKCTLYFDLDDPTRPYATDFHVPVYGDYEYTIGRAAMAQFVALSDKVEDNFISLKSMVDQIKSQFNVHTHPLSTGTSSATLSTVTNSYSYQDVASTKLRTE